MKMALNLEKQLLFVSQPESQASLLSFRLTHF